jgi:DNA-binding transcriptional LysR family regulator
MSMRHPDWDSHHAFLAVLESGSLSAAARLLSLTQPTVRFRIEALERALGQTLFVRASGGMVPTDQARALAEPARQMAFAAQAFHRAAAGPPGQVAGTVRLSVADFIGIEVLPAMLDPLLAAHPALDIELALSNRPADLLHQEADIAIRMARPSQGALRAQHVGRIPLGFFAAPAYARRHGVPETVEALAGHRLIGSDRAPADLALAGRMADLTGHPVRFALRTDSHPAQLAAVRAGLGIGVVQVPVGQRDLLRVLPEVTVAELDVWIVAHEDLRHAPRIDAVFRHLVAQLGGFCRKTDQGRSVMQAP